MSDNFGDENFVDGGKRQFYMFFFNVIGISLRRITLSPVQ